MFSSQALLKMLFVFCPGKCEGAIFPGIPDQGPSVAAGGDSSWLLAAQLLVLDFFIRSVARSISELGVGYYSLVNLVLSHLVPYSFEDKQLPQYCYVSLPWYRVPSCVVIAIGSAGL